MTIEQPPPWLAAAWAELGQREVEGDGDNSRILAFYREVGHTLPAHDELAWCAAFVGACLERCGIASTRSLMARSYLRWGIALDEPRIGAITALSRGGDPSLGHVGFYLGQSGEAVFLLGGNQSDAVTVAPFPKSRLLGYRWPWTSPREQIAQSPASSPPVLSQPAPVLPELFEAALTHVLEMEGGYTDDPEDPGGPTNLGITIATLAGWRGVALTRGTYDDLRRSVREITRGEARAIYEARYWRPARCPDLPPALALFHFDAAVNHGVGGAARLLQQALGADVDGEIGPQTLALARSRPLSGTLDRYAALRRERYRALPHFPRFGRGWLRRVEVTLALALRTAMPAASGPSVPSETTSGAPAMSEPHDTASPSAPAPNPAAGKWWGESITIWGAIISAAATILPAMGPLLGLELTADAVRQIGAKSIEVVQAIAALVGLLMTVFGRVRASQPLERRSLSLRL